MIGGIFVFMGLILGAFIAYRIFTIGSAGGVPRVVLSMLLILVGLFGGEAKWMGSSLSGWIAIVAFITILIIFGGAAGWWYDWDWFYNFFGVETVAIIVMILVFAIIVWWVTRGEGKEKEANALSGKEQM